MIKKLNLIVTELVIIGRKLSKSFVFIIKSYFTVSKSIRLNPRNYFFVKIPNKRGIQQID